MKKILIIDDEEWLREMIQLALRQRGYEVVEAHNGQEGIEKARAELPDLILCDVNMGKVNGYLTLAALRTEAPTAAIPFILMTGLADNAGMRHGMELGADDYLPKPFTTEVLYAAVEARLKKSQTVRDEAESKLRHLRDNISLMMPHEMRTPLNGIISNAELLANSAATLKPADVTEMGQEILNSSQRLERLIENFLIYAQLELIAADVSHCITDEQLAALMQTTAKMQRAYKRGDLNAYVWANVEFHDLNTRIANNQTAKRIIDSLLLRTVPMRRLSLSQGTRMRESLADHQHLVQAYENRDSTLAAALIRSNHITALAALERCLK